MSEFKDLERSLIEQTKGGSLDWNVSNGDVGYWWAMCGEMGYMVSESGMVRVYGKVRPRDLQYSSYLLKLLQEHKPMLPKLNEEETLKLALECLEENEGK